VHVSSPITKSLYPVSLPARLTSLISSDNRAISTFTFSGDVNSKSVTMETAMVVADFSGKGLGASGAIMAAAFLPKCK
jgi:hypothetical protein